MQLKRSVVFLTTSFYFTFYEAGGVGSVFVFSFGSSLGSTYEATKLSLATFASSFLYFFPCVYNNFLYN